MCTTASKDSSHFLPWKSRYHSNRAYSKPGAEILYDSIKWLQRLRQYSKSAYARPNQLQDYMLSGFVSRFIMQGGFLGSALLSNRL